jgi:hypothetical protein
MKLLTRAACGCIVRGGRHIIEKRVFAVDVYQDGEYLETLDAVANTRTGAKSSIMVRLYRMGVGLQAQRLTLIPDSAFTVRESECCRDDNWCQVCDMRADNPFCY